MTAIILNARPHYSSLVISSSTNAGQVNRDVRFERTVAGKLISMPPTGGETGKRSGEIFGELWVGNQQQRLGIAFDSSTGFKLPNGEERSPDAAWVKLERWKALKKGATPALPTFGT